MDKFTEIIISIADILCGYPLFFLLIGGGAYLFVRSGFASIRLLPDAIRELRKKDTATEGQISSLQALASVVSATIGLGNIAGVTIALVMGGPGAIFWMWVSAIVGMSTKLHEGILAIKYRNKSSNGTYHGGPMYIIEKGLGQKWKPLAIFFAVAGMFGTMCIMNANQLAEATLATFTTPEEISSNSFLCDISAIIGLNNTLSLRLIIGLLIAMVVSAVVLGGIKRIAKVASFIVPFMVISYFLMVLYIIVTHISALPEVIASIFTEAFNLQAGIGALVGIAIIGARRAALVNDAGVGTASIMHGESRNNKPVREGLIAMLGPSIDSGFVCTLTAIAILLCVDLPAPGSDIKGLEIAMDAFRNAIPAGEYLLFIIILCFGLSSMFSYSFYGSRCATYLFGPDKSKFYTYIFILSMVLFAVIPLNAVIGICDLFYGLMAFPTMFALIALSGKVREEIRTFKIDKNH